MSLVAKHDQHHISQRVAVSVVANDPLLAPELARFCVDPQTPRWSSDKQAFYVPTMRVAPALVRAVVNGRSLFDQMQGVHLLHVRDQMARFHHANWTFVWGDLQVFETGEPTIAQAMFLRGEIAVPDLTVVGRYLRELRDQAPKAS